MKPSSRLLLSSLIVRLGSIALFSSCLTAYSKTNLEWFADLKAADWGIRYAALKALEKSVTPKDESLLLELIRSKDWPKQTFGLMLIAKAVSTPAPQTLKEVHSLSESPRRIFRVYATLALATWGIKEAEPRAMNLRGYLEHLESAVREGENSADTCSKLSMEALRILASKRGLSDETIRVLIDDYKAFSQSDYRKLSYPYYREKSDSEYKKFFEWHGRDSFNYKEQRNILTVLAATRNASLVPFMSDLALNQRNVEAIYYLGQIDTPEAKEALIHSLRRQTQKGARLIIAEVEVIEQLRLVEFIPQLAAVKDDDANTCHPALPILNCRPLARAARKALATLSAVEPRLATKPWWRFW